MVKFIRKDILYILPLLIFIGLAYFLWQGLSIDPHWLPSTLINKPLPAFDLAALDAGQRFSNKQLQGQVAIINVWASWCSACRSEHPLLLDIAHSRQAVIYGLNYKDNPNAANRWLKRFGNPYQRVGLDSDGKVGIDLGVYGTPETYIIDRHGFIRYRHIGALILADWQNQLLPLIKQLEQQ